MTDLEPARPLPSAVGGEPRGSLRGGVNLLIEPNQPRGKAAQTITPGENSTIGRAGQEAGLNGQETSKNGAGGVAEQNEAIKQIEN